jgi:hypothetical protein
MLFVLYFPRWLLRNEVLLDLINFWNLI